jgi:aspartate ammonia-lyase
MVASSRYGLRTESDSLGNCELPADCLYGISTYRGSRNFNISNRQISREPALLHALARIKKAAALANGRIGAVSMPYVDAIVRAADEVLAGAHHEYFVIDILEGSGGTSINMNVNEVLANRANQLLGGLAGDYSPVHPNDHVNRGQSTNDVVPSALKLAVLEKADPLLNALLDLGDGLAAKADEFGEVLRMGRTCMQGAQPMTLGQAFGGYASVVRRSHGKLITTLQGLRTLPIGGTAIGTGLGAAPGYRGAVIEALSEILGHPVYLAENMFDAMQNADELARVSGELRIVGDVVGKIASDLIILCSGPNSGLGEVILPTVQAGSSIMPGKVNPVIPIMMQQIAFAVTGNDTAVSMAALQGQLEINHFEPIMASRMFDSMDLLTRGARLFAEKCVAGLDANREQSLNNLMQSNAMASVFLPALGYAKVTEIVRDSLKENRPFVDVAIERGLMSRDDVMRTLSDSTRYAEHP